MSSSHPPVRVALVGFGRIANSHVEALGSLDATRLVAVIEPRESVGRAAAEQHGCDWFPDFRDGDVLERIDAAVVCTPPDTHHEIAGHFLRNGKHTLCEKPLALSQEHAQDLEATASGSGVTLMMASKFRFVPDVVAAKALIEAGTIGEVVHFENAFCSRVLMKDRWNAHAQVAGGGVLVDNGSHSVDIARYLLGPVQGVQVAFGRNSQGLAVEDNVFMRLRTRSGAVGSVELSWSLNKESPYYIGVYGDGGVVQIGWKESRYRQEGGPDWISFGTGYDKVGAFERQLENFVDTLRGVSEPRIGPRDAIASVAVIQAAYRSEAESRWIEVPDEDR
jgi:predicted dehydrogenase